MSTRRQALMRAYVPAQAYAQDLEQINSQVKSEVERSDALAKLASDARDQLARTQEATRVRIETGNPLSPTDIEFLRNYTSKTGAVGIGLPAIPKKIQDNLTNNLLGNKSEAWTKFVKDVSSISSPIQRAAAIQAGYADPAFKGFVNEASLQQALKDARLASEGYTTAQLGRGSPSIKATSTGVSSVEQKKADALASALQEASPSGFAGGPEGREWRASLPEEDEALLTQYVSALSDPTSTAQAISQIPPDQLKRAKELYQEATNRGGYQKQQAQLYSAAMQTALRASQEAENRASNVRVDYRSPSAEARKRALAAQGVTDSASAIRALFQGTGLEDRVGSIMERTKDPLGHEPKDDFEEAVRKAWAAGVKPEDLDQVLQSRPGSDMSGSSSGWKDAIKGFKARWKTPTDQRDAARAYYTGLGVQDAVEKARKIKPTKAEQYAQTKRDTEEQAAQIEAVDSAPPTDREKATKVRENEERQNLNEFRRATQEEAHAEFKKLVASGMNAAGAIAELKKRGLVSPPPMPRIVQDGEPTYSVEVGPIPSVESTPSDVEPPPKAQVRTKTGSPASTRAIVPAPATPVSDTESQRLYKILMLKGTDGTPSIKPGSPQHDAMVSRIRELRAQGK